jgi:hypothetical protein
MAVMITANNETNKRCVIAITANVGGSLVCDGSLLNIATVLRPRPFERKFKFWLELLRRYNPKACCHVCRRLRNIHAQLVLCEHIPPAARQDRCSVVSFEMATLHSDKQINKR